jgi:hypothetical protein
MDSLSTTSEALVMIDDMLGGEQQAASSKPMLQDYKKFKHGKGCRRKLKFNTLNLIF